VFEIDDGKNVKRVPKRSPVIKVLGIGGAGNNAINRLVEAGIEGVTLMAANTDLQTLEACRADVLIQLGKEITRGLGAGGYPDIGEKATLESKDELIEHLEDADMLFITAGLGGGTGTGGAPIVAEISRELGILTIAIVTTPFYFEGNGRWKIAADGVKKLKGKVDALIKISNNKLLEELPDDISVIDAFKEADEILLQGIKGISELITQRGYINLDFADVEAVLRDAGTAMLGIGIGRGENRAMDSARNALESKLLEHPIENATAVIFNVTAAPNIKMKEVHMAAAVIRQACSEDADVKFGFAIDESLEDEMKIILVATGFMEEEEKIIYPDTDIPAIYRMGFDLENLQ